MDVIKPKLEYHRNRIKYGSENVWIKSEDLYKKKPEYATEGITLAEFKNLRHEKTGRHKNCTRMSGRYQ